MAVALCFDGVNDYVRVHDSPSLDVSTGSFTIDAWVRTTWSGEGVVVLQDKRDQGGTGYHLHLYRRDLYTQGRAVPAIQVAKGGVGFENHNAVSAPNVADGKWHHIAAVADVPKREIRIYMDGALVYTGTSQILGHNLNNDSDFYLGMRAPSQQQLGPGYFPGCLDEVELFKRALTQAEIQKIFNAGPAGKCKPSCVQPPSDLTAWWPLDEISGTVANDLALVNNQGTHVNGPTPIPGMVDGALHFDGVDDYVRVPNHSDLNVSTGSFTIDAWVRTTWKSDWGVVVLQDKRDQYAGYSLHLYTRREYTQGRVVPALNVTYIPGGGPGFENHNAVSAPDVADGNWHHIAAVADVPNRQIRIYMDGALVYTGASQILGQNLDNTSDFYLGMRVPLHGGGGHFPGELDEVELFKRALTQAEIQKIFNAGPAGKCKR